MKFDKYLRGVFFLLITITGVSIILISNFISTYEEEQEFKLFLEEYSNKRSFEILKEIDDVERNLNTIGSDADVLDYLLSEDIQISNKQSEIDDLKFYIFSIMDIEKLFNVVIFVNGEASLIMQNVEYIQFEDIDLTKKYQIFDQGAILTINVEKILSDGTRINTVAIKDANLLFTDRQSFDNSIFMSGTVDGESFGIIPEKSFKTYSSQSTFDRLQSDFTFEFHKITQDQFTYNDSYPLLLSIAIPVTFAPLIASLVAKKFSSNIETLLKISKREKGHQKISFDELISVADEIEEDRYNLEIVNATLNEQLDKLNTLGYEKEVFNSAISHSMKTSLVTIQGYSEMMLETETNPQQRKILENIIDSTLKLKIQISNILDATKFEEIDKMVLKNETTDLDEIKNLISNSFSKMFELNKIDFKIITTIENLSFETNKTVISQILGNLFTNAIEFSNKGGRVTLEIRHDDSKIYFIVSDNGKGIKKEFHSELFSKYSSSSYDLNRMYGGAGLGLYISKKLANNLGGDLSLTSSVENKGSTFTLELPIS